MTKEQKRERLAQGIALLKESGVISTQGQVAHDLGYLREQTISDMLTGKANITGRFIVAFLDKYNINRRWWDTGEGFVDTPTTPGERLRYIRKRLNLGQVEFGRLLGGDDKPINVSSISKYEAGSMPIAKKVLLELYTRLNVRKEYLFDGELPIFSGEQAAAPSFKVNPPTNEQEQAIRFYKLWKEERETNRQLQDRCEKLEERVAWLEYPPLQCLGKG